MICRVFWLVIMQFQDRYNQCLQSMFGLRRFGIKLGLDTILAILKGLDNPQNKFLSVHIAGTNGKGSIASALSSIFNQAGYCVGLYTSPHLVKFNERIRINGVPVSDMDVLNAYEAVRDIYAGDREPTFFEYTTAMAFHEFARAKVDWAIVETGMGGRLDATNVLNPQLSIISNISLEHRQYLGNSIAEITAEKGGIIKQGIPVVTGVSQKEAVEVLKDIAQKKEATLFRLGEHFRVRKNKGSETFSYIGIKSIWKNMKAGLQGNHQIENAALTLAACEVLNRRETSFNIEQIKEGLLKTNWPGRMEVVSQAPYIILDGAHNLMAARKLAKFISENFAKNKTTLVIGILDDKPYKGMLKSLLPLCKRVILTKPAINRALEPEILHQFAKDFTEDIKIIPSVKDAFFYAMESVSSDEAICVAGSLYVVGEVKQALSDKS
jgi:dihydrofolate synthase / folylpolyglutamate synthase